jgi:hypothetical protein
VQKINADKIKIIKTAQLNKPDNEALRVVLQFIKFAKRYLDMVDHNITVKMVHANPDMPLTTACYDPNHDLITVIVQNRHPIDCCRSIAHEMIHQRQKYQNRLNGVVQEIGGDIEDEANAAAGRVVKEFIKNQLTEEQKRFLGLGKF